MQVLPAVLYFWVLLPVAALTLIDYATNGKLEQITIVCSYMVFIFTLAYVDIEMFIFISDLKNYWTNESIKDIQIHLEDLS